MRFSTWAFHLIPTGLVIFGMALGAFASHEVMKHTNEVYQAEGSFVIDELPFSIQEDTVSSNDAETTRQFLQSLVLAISGEQMREQMAEDLGVPGTNLAFADHDLTLKLTERDQANVALSVSRSSRSVTVTAQTIDRDFGVKVVASLLQEVKILNRISGRLQEIAFRLKLNREELSTLTSELSAQAAERIRAGTEETSVEQYEARGWPLDTFPSFSTDSTLGNMRTQLLLVQSEYAALAVEGTGGTNLRGKKREVDNLLDQIAGLTQGLRRGIRTSYEMAQSRETQLRAQVEILQQSTSHLQDLKTLLSKGLGDFAAVKDMDKTDPTLKAESNVILVVDPAFSVPVPIWPHASQVYGAGIAAGTFMGLALAGIVLQIRYGVASLLLKLVKPQ